VVLIAVITEMTTSDESSEAIGQNNKHLISKFLGLQIKILFNILPDAFLLLFFKGLSKQYILKKFNMTKRMVMDLLVSSFLSPLISVFYIPVTHLSQLL
jgi:hypothetical protein